ncbi:hypothetical protein GCM10011575_44450 [Microlunatus endophyticus]|uniref:Uncharacterized protein n=1 Tax=Microlunatus endophyticus TaxID=1716077 RepID=A0A917SIM1_9ACTN|nr:hypothetical protein GCM10011575_44450 [Microlunatus endophyticus]
MDNHKPMDPRTMINWLRRCYWRVADSRFQGLLKHRSGEYKWKRAEQRISHRVMAGIVAPLRIWRPDAADATGRTLTERSPADGVRSSVMLAHNPSTHAVITHP